MGLRGQEMKGLEFCSQTRQAIGIVCRGVDTVHDAAAHTQAAAMAGYILLRDGVIATPQLRLALVSQHETDAPSWPCHGRAGSTVAVAAEPLG